MSRFVVTVPRQIASEASYVVRWVLCNRLGLPDPLIEQSDKFRISLGVPEHAGSVSSDCVGGWSPAATEVALPAPTALNDDIASGLPIIFGHGYIRRHPDKTELAFDLWGTIFWYLSRVEELETNQRDKWGCYRAEQSYIERNGLLQRPVVDEYVDLLGHLLQETWPGLSWPKSVGRTQVTCDVDVPYSTSLRGPRYLARTVGSDLLLRRSVAAAKKTVKNYWLVKTRNDYSCDVNNTFDWIMDRCEEQNSHAAFFIISGNHAVDLRYDLSEPVIEDLLRSIDRRGHEIGMHGSFVTYRDSAAFSSEADNLRATCSKLGLQVHIKGNRQHYLRWDMRLTQDLIFDAGFEYDSSLGFSDKAGFRCGTSHEFPLWSWQKNAPLALKERPLIAMEASVFEPMFMALGPEQGCDLMLSLKKRCIDHGGVFTLLWHNSRLQSPVDREVFQTVLRA